MPVLCIQGFQSSVGSSTVTANVARNLYDLNQDVLVIDLNPNNLLRLHFNMDWFNKSGWALNVLNDEPWYKAGFKCEIGVNFIPFGGLSYDNQLDLLDKINVDTWLTERLNLAKTSENKWLILNTGSELNNLSIQALNYADNIIRVLEPLVTSVSLISDSIQSNYLKNDSALNTKCLYLINKFMPLSQLDHDTSLVLKAHLGSSLIPVKIYYDENIKEALAQKTTVQLYSPESATSKQFKTLATWIMLHFSHKVSA